MSHAERCQICINLYFPEFLPHNYTLPLYNTILTRYYAPFAPYYLYKNLLWRYVYPQFMLPSAIHGKFDKNGRTLRLRQTRGRLELAIPPCIESSYLLASDTPTKRLATWQQARGGAKTASRFLTTHTSRLH